MIVSFSIANYEFVAHILLQAARLLANLIIMGSGIMARAFVQAYRQALANASKNGVAQEAVQNIRRGSKMMTEAEARQILVSLTMQHGKRFCRSMITCSSGMLRMALSTSSQRFIEPKNAWKQFINQKSKAQINSVLWFIEWCL
ncbi:UNVERIFIED_CONTAM: Mitochondrial import inner membrane translocase subunit PAM16 like 2 [Sesamum angustifolium]|uniref:Mitochondrial import inner membrane translocase subunit PAM16 like 2 n=1 Tax=Sesamum angustifolium TaxID=2727405 RepID=A0AAW2RJ95_9LAMI